MNEDGFREFKNLEQGMGCFTLSLAIIAGVAFWWVAIRVYEFLRGVLG